MRIAIFCHTAGMAGAELAIAESIRALMEHGHEVYVAVPEDGPFLRHVEPYIAGHTLLYQDHWTGTASLTLWQKIKFLRGYFHAAQKAKNWLRQTQADVALTNTSTIVAGALGAAWAGVPHVWYIHEFVVEDHGLVWQYGELLSYRLMNALSRSLIVNSLAVKAKLQRFIPTEKLHLVYCATEIDWQPLQDSDLPSAPTLLMAGAISEGKNQTLAVQALAEKPLTDLQASLVVIGAGPEAEKSGLRTLAESLGVADRLDIFPFSTDRRAVFGLGRALIVASRAEAFGRVTVEAQKSGLPVLVADAGAAREVVEDGHTGLLFQSGDPASLARAAARLLSDPFLFASLQHAGREEALRRFSLQTHWEQLLPALQAALAHVR